MVVSGHLWLPLAAPGRLLPGIPDHPLFLGLVFGGLCLPLVLHLLLNEFVGRVFRPG